MNSYCTPCTQLKEISVCTDAIIVGTVGTNNTAYNIYLRSLANDMIVKFTATSSGAGLLTITSTGGFNLATSTGYELWVNKVSSIAAQENLTIGTGTHLCYTVNFIRVNGQTYTSQTLELA